MDYPNFAAVEEPTFSEAAVVILPVPYEGTVSYGGGTADGPAAILQASEQVELYDEQLASVPTEIGVVVDRSFRLPRGSAGTVSAEVKRRVGELLQAGKKVIMLGGEHSITSGATAAAAEAHPGLVVVQLDAHADLRDSYRGDRYSHACAMARVLEHSEVRGVGIRSYGRAEAARIREGIPGYSILRAWEMQRRGWEGNVLQGLEGRPVYLTIDLDYFDPSVIPATGTPEPGGGQWWPTIRFLARLFETARVVAADVVELAPLRGMRHAEFTAARLVHKLIGMWLALDTKRHQLLT